MGENTLQLVESVYETHKQEAFLATGQEGREGILLHVGIGSLQQPFSGESRKEYRVFLTQS